MKIYLIFISSIVLISCNAEQDLSSEKNIHNHYVYNSSVSNSLHNFNKAFNKLRTELEFESGVKVNNCKSYEKQIITSQLKDGINNQIVKSEYLICDALILLGNKAYDYHNTDTIMANLLAEKLDLRSFPSSLRPQLDNKNKTFKNLAGTNLLVKDNRIVYETTDWHYKTEIIAVADFNHNNKNDWLLWFSDESKTGNYRGYQTLIVYDIEESERNIKAQSFPVITAE